MQNGNDSCATSKVRVQTNILDPVHDQLDQRLYDGIDPRPATVKFIQDHIYKVLGKIIAEPESYFDLFLTGSITTYQYSDGSDCDITIFPDYESLSKAFEGSSWPSDIGSIRKRLILTVINHLDGLPVPGTPFPIQGFVALPGDRPEDMYKPGMRSAWSFRMKDWYVPPEKDRVHDVQKELPLVYLRAHAIGEKMRDALEHDPKAAIKLYKQVHLKRSNDQRAGRGDFSEGNVMYKYLANAGYFDRLRDIGLHIAKVAGIFDRFRHKYQDGWDELNDWLQRKHDEEGDPNALYTPLIHQTPKKYLPRTIDHLYTDKYDPNEDYRWAYHPDYGGLKVWPYKQGWHRDWELTENFPHGPDAYAGGAIDKNHVDEYHGAKVPEISDTGINSVVQWMMNQGHKPSSVSRWSLFTDPLDEDPTDPKITPMAGRPDAGFEDWTCPNCKASGRDGVYEDPEGGYECFKCGTPIVSHVAAMSKSMQVIYNFQTDRIILGSQAESANLPSTILVGTYENGDVTLNEAANQWMNTRYFKKLWLQSFPTFPLHSVHLHHTDGHKHRLAEQLKMDLGPAEWKYPQASDILYQQAFVYLGEPDNYLLTEDAASMHSELLENRFGYDIPNVPMLMGHIGVLPTRQLSPNSLIPPVMPQQPATPRKWVFMFGSHGFRDRALELSLRNKATAAIRKLYPGAEDVTGNSTTRWWTGAFE